MGIENRGYYRDSGELWGDSTRSASQSLVVTLIVINSAVFLLNLFSPATANGASRWLNDQLLLSGTWYQRPWEVWRLLTYGFAHGSVSHILFNMLTLYFLGQAVEHQMGRREFLWFYLSAVVISGTAYLASCLIFPSSGCLGASGAVTAVLIWFACRNPDTPIRVWGIWELPAWVVGVSLVILNLLMTVGGSQGVAVEVHLMGAAYGALYFYRDWRLSELNWQFWRRGPRLQIHAPDDEEDAAEDRQWRQLQEDGDRLLEKINQHGEASLTNKERKTLQRYSEALRKRRR